MDEEIKKFSLSDLEKVETHSDLIREKFQPNQELEAILKVNRSNHVPPKVKVRARIDEEMFTGTMLAKDLEEIESDPGVKSVAISKVLRIVE